MVLCTNVYFYYLPLHTRIIQLVFVNILLWFVDIVVPIDVFDYEV